MSTEWEAVRERRVPRSSVRQSVAEDGSVGRVNGELFLRRKRRLVVPTRRRLAVDVQPREVVAAAAALVRRGQPPGPLLDLEAVS